MRQVMYDDECFFRVMVLVMRKNIIEMGMRHNQIPITMRVGEERTPHKLFHKHNQQYKS